MDKRTLKKIIVPIRYCIICKKPIIRNTKSGEKRINIIQYSKSLFCSRKCRGKWQSINLTEKNSTNYRGGKTICIDCGKMLNYRYSYRNTLRCKKCYQKFIHNNPNKSFSWKGGKCVDKSGYIYIHQLNHPFADKNNYVFEHRLVAEKCLGRYLTRKEVIHHINEIKNDNRPENLYLFQDAGKHITYHFSKNKLLLKSNFKD